MKLLLSIGKSFFQQDLEYAVSPVTKCERESVAVRPVSVGFNGLKPAHSSPTRTKMIDERAEETGYILADS